MINKGFDLKSWLIGFILGLAGKPLPQVSLPDVGKHHDTLYIRNATVTQTNNILEVT